METIAFPGLGLEFSLSPYLVKDLEIFGLTLNIKWYGVLIALGFLLAVIYAFRRCRSFGINPDRMLDVVLVTTVVAFIGARLYYVVFSDDVSYYFENPVRILEVWKGGLAIYGGILFAFIGGLVTTKWRKVPTLAMFDMASLGFLIGQAMGRWGNFFNQEAFGGNTDLPWGMTGSIIQTGVNGAGYDSTLPVHPTFLYESLWCVLGFVLLHIITKKAYTYQGKIFSLYLVWYGAGRFLIEGLRTDSLYIGSMRVSQLVAVLTVLLGVFLLFFLRGKKAVTPLDLFEETATEAEDAPQDENEEILTLDVQVEGILDAENAAVEDAGVAIDLPVEEE